MINSTANFLSVEKKKMEIDLVKLFKLVKLSYFQTKLLRLLVEEIEIKLYASIIRKKVLYSAIINKCKSLYFRNDVIKNKRVCEL